MDSSVALNICEKALLKVKNLVPDYKKYDLKKGLFRTI